MPREVVEERLNRMIHSVFGLTSARCLITTVGGIISGRPGTFPKCACLM